ncbi:MAG TPA: EpsI family protein [Gammaproteobacteria bacterium]|nr:EpsI family protein [Gammaproteobacteria bacterium]
MKPDIEQTCPGWRSAGISVALLLLAAMLLYQQTLFYLTGFWNQLETGEYAHGYLVLAISAYLILRSRESLSRLTPCPDYRALLAVLVSSLFWLVGALVGVLVVQAVALLLLVLSLVWVTLGPQVSRRLAFPVLFIIFAIPVWFPLSPMLQDLTANTVFAGVRLLKIPAFLQENRIVLPAGTLSVEEACSGMRYLLAALTLGALYAYLNYQRFRTRLLVVIITATAGVLANILRVFIIVYLGYSTEMQHPLVYDHLMLGWYLFGGLVILLLVIDAQLYRRQQARLSRVDVGNVKKEKEPVSGPCAVKKWQYPAVVILAFLLLLTGPVLVYRIDHLISSHGEDIVLTMPAAPPGWSVPGDNDDDWIPLYRGAISEQQAYSKGEREVLLYVGYYPVAQQGKELIAHYNHINNADIWQTNYSRARNSTAGDIQVLEQQLENKHGNKRLVWYWYNVGGWTTSSKYEAKALQALGLLTGKTYSYVIAVATDEAGSLEQAQKLMRDFISATDMTFEALVNRVQTPVDGR